MTRLGRLLLVPALLVLPVAGCARDEPAGAFDDPTLFAAIEGLDGVESSTTTYQDSLGTSRLYSASLRVEDDADPRCVIYQTLALLGQGRPLATTWVEVEQGGRTLDQTDLASPARRAAQSAAPTSSTQPTVPDCGAIDLGGAWDTPAPSPSDTPSPATP